MSKTKILIVEDEVLYAFELFSSLEGCGFEPLKTVATGRKAIIAVKENNPDLILMDIHLKGNMDGIQTAETILKIKNIPVIFLTAHSDEVTVKKAEKMMDMLLAKKRASDRKAWLESKGNLATLQ